MVNPDDKSLITIDGVEYKLVYAPKKLFMGGKSRIFVNRADAVVLTVEVRWFDNSSRYQRKQSKKLTIKGEQGKLQLYKVPGRQIFVIAKPQKESSISADAIAELLKDISDYFQATDRNYKYDVEKTLDLSDEEYTKLYSRRDKENDKKINIAITIVIIFIILVIIYPTILTILFGFPFLIIMFIAYTDDLLNHRH